MRPRPPHPRLVDWPERLAALVEARRHLPFAWGAHDCCTWMADAVVAVTGRDPAAPWRGQYTTEAEAMAMLGASGLEAVVAARMVEFGAPECPVRAVQRGDAVLAVLRNEPLLGVALGPRIAVPGIDRLQWLPLSAGVRAWAV